VEKKGTEGGKIDHICVGFLLYLRDSRDHPRVTEGGKGLKTLPPSIHATVTSCSPASVTDPIKSLFPSGDSLAELARATTCPEGSCSDSTTLPLASTRKTSP